ncbi:MAG: spore maturation protein [Oscillospiraceae bacterium]|nr:spore maturation protein [Oscillospiraceae bacterium]
MSGGAIALLIAFTSVYALMRRTELYPALTDGIGAGLKTVLSIFPSLTAMICAVYMLRASGALDAFSALLSPLLSHLGISSRLAPLMLIRPLSGSGALAFGSEVINSLGPDSVEGRVAAVMLASSETTFYVVSVYSSGAGVKRLGYAIPAALIADLVVYIAAGITVKLLF